MPITPESVPPLLTGYSITRILYQSASTIVYRAQRADDHCPVVIKTASEAVVERGVHAGYQREFEALKRVAGPGIIDVFDLQVRQGICCLVVEDFGAQSLDVLASRRRFDVPQVVNLGLRVARILERIHRHGVIHKDINPSNILFNPHTDQVKLIDFGSCWLAVRQDPTIRPLHLLDGTLAYMSPEQTGRINRPIDFRTDFYSLGVTLYELLSGRLPFDTDDVHKLVHGHIARQPTPLRELCPELPTPLVDITMKLMAKAADERYQSAWGLQHDLAACAERYREGRSLTGVRIGLSDISDRLRLPQRLYGRGRARQRLREAFERVRHGGREVAIVTGPAGVGKSALVTELYKPVTEHGGYFIMGKFDPYRRGIPYSAVATALTALVDALLAEPEPVLARWRTDLSDALGSSGQVLIDIIPNLELLLGAQPPVPRVAGPAAHNRLQRAFHRLLGVLCTATHPLVLFFDDLQWADAASVAWIRSSMTHPHTRHLLVIVSYRDGDDDARPFAGAARDIRAHGVAIDELTLAPLARDDVGQFLADALHRDVADCDQLAELVIAKTHGNPLFIDRFLHQLYREQHLVFDAEQRRWVWSMTDIQSLDITDNVVEWMLRQLHALPSHTQRVLELAACIGDRFDMRTLTALCDPARDVHRDLQPAIELGLIQPIADAPDEAADSFLFAAYRFLHDRLQQAVYAVIDEDRKLPVHLHIARLLRSSVSDEQRDARIFEVVEHFNRGAAGLTEDDERLAVARLNLTAGRRALTAMAYQTALDVLRAGLALVPAPVWQDHHDITRDLSLAAVEAEHLSGNHSDASELSRQILQHARSALDRANVHQFEILSLIARGRMNQAIDLALDVLPIIGVSLPREPDALIAYQRALAARLLDRGAALRAVDDVGELTDPTTHAALRILCSACSAAIIANPTVLPSMVLTAIEQVVTHGHAPLSAMVYAWQAAHLCSAGDIARGDQFSEFALTLLDRFPAPGIEIRTRVTLHAFVLHWTRPITDILGTFPPLIQAGLERGEQEYACFAAIDYLSALMFAGRPLPEVRDEQAHYAELIERCGMAFQLDSTRAWMRSVEAAMNPGPDAGEQFERGLTALLGDDSNLQLRALIDCIKLMEACYFGDYQRALTYGERGERDAPITPGTLNTAQHNAFYSLAMLACASQATGAHRQALLDKVAANQARMQSWTEHAPANFGHRYAFIEAERARDAGDPLRAMQWFDDAIDGASENAYLGDEALMRERAADFYRTLGRTEIARMYLQTAYRCYQRWGALAKASQLERHYPWLLGTNPHAASLARTPGSSPVSSTGDPSLSFDASSVIKASQAISGELVINRLSITLLELIIENVGAQRGFLILTRGDVATVEAEGDISRSSYFALPSIPVTQLEDQLSVAIVNYVTRTRSSLVLSDAQESRFISDPYVATQRPRSLLCAPIMSAGELYGVIYLENNLTRGVFNEARLEVVNILASQAAISLRNARLMAALERSVAELRDAKRDVERASRAKSEFLASVNHELRTPLNGVIGALELLSGVAHAGEQREYLDTAAASADQLMRIIKDTLDLSKLEVGRFELDPAEFDLARCIDGVVRMIAVSMRQRDLAFTCDVAPDVPGGVIGDADRLRQVLINLLGNALKFTEPGGSVSLRVSNRGHVGPDHVTLAFEVSDTGIGIPEVALRSIFEPFYQSRQTDSSVSQGSGLGLAIASQLVALMGGQIEASSEPGRGSTFSFTAKLGLSSTPLTALDATAGADAAASCPPLRVLLAEDNPINQKIASRLLERDGHTVTIAGNGAEAVAAWEASAFDVILMDGQMPVMDGFSATREIRRRERGGRTPIIAVTAYTLADDIKRCLATGMDDYISKPIDLPALRVALQAVTRGSAVAAAADPAVDRPSETELD